MTTKIKNILLIFVCIIIIGILVLYNLVLKKENVEESVVNRGQVAKAVSLLFHSESDIDKLEDDNFKNSKEWYVKYVNYMYEDTYFTKNQVKPLEREVLKSFTYKDLDNLFTNMGVIDKKLMAYVNNN